MTKRQQSQKPTIHAHHDADGVTSAYFLYRHLGGKADIYFPPEFGLTDTWKTGDWMVDMRPDNPDIQGTVIDHHPNHDENRKYKLIWRHYPASLITFELFKEDIPEKEWWKLAIGLMGDGSIEYLPYEVASKHKYLMKEIHTSTYWDSKRGEWKINDYQLLKLLSSPINALCRVGKEDYAFQLLKIAKNPFQLIDNQEAKEAKRQVSDEFARIIKSMKYIILDKLVIVTFSSNMRMAGYIATRVGQDKWSDKTVMAINTETGKLSMRGDLTLYYTGLLNENIPYIEISGHPGFSGGKVELENLDNLIQDLIEVI